MQAGNGEHGNKRIELPAPFFPWIRHKKPSESHTGSLGGYCGETGRHIRRGVMEDGIGT